MHPTPFFTRLISLLGSAFFIFSSLLPASAFKTDLSHLRPSASTDRGIRGRLHEALLRSEEVVFIFSRHGSKGFDRIRKKLDKIRLHAQRSGKKVILLLEQAGPSLDLTFQHHPELSESLLSRNKKDTVLLEKRFKQIKDQIRTLYERIKKGEIPEDLNEFHKQVAKYIIEHKLDFVLELENIDFDLWQIEMLKEAFDRIIVQEFYEGDEETYLPLLLKEVSYDRTGVLRRDEALIRQIEEIQSTVPNSMVIALRGSLHSKTGMAEALREKGIPARSVIPGEPASLLLLVPHDEVTIKLIQEDRGPTDKEIDLLLKQIPFDQLGIILTLQDPFARFSLLRGIVDRLNREEIIELSHALSQNGGVGAGPPFIFHWLQEKDKMTHEEAKAFDPRLWEKGKTSPDGGRKEKPWSLIPLYYP